jgi:uncharacterized repeat protein (TIGR01451 family)
LASGGSDQTLDFGYYQTASLGDFVWVDSNANGKQDAGEAGLGGVTVKLLNATGTTVLATTTTDASGAYHFTGLNPGQYEVQFVAPTGYTLTTQNAAGTTTANDSNANVTTGITAPVTLVSGQIDNTIDAGLVANSGDLSITKTDGLTTVSPGQTVTYSIVVSNNGSANATGAVVNDVMPTNLTNVTWISTATAGASGNHASGTGNINDTVNLASGASITYAVTGTVSPTVLSSHFADFGAGTNNTNLGQNTTINGIRADAFYIDTNKVYQTSSTVLWERDVPNDHGIGVWSKGEPDPVASGGDVNELSNQLNNEVIRLTKNSGEQWTSLWVSSLDSGGSGGTEMGTLYWSNSATPDLSTASKFTFKFGDFGTNTAEGDVLSLHPTGFDPNASYVFFVAGPNPAGNNNDYLVWQASTAATSTTLVNTATVTSPNGFTDTNTSNNSATDSDSIVSKARVGDVVWDDLNHNGIQDDGELGIAGVTVKLENTVGAVLATTITDANGLYHFDVAAGTYQIQVVAPTGYLATLQNHGSDVSLDSNINASGLTGQFTVAAGQENLTIDAGLYRNASIGDRIWYDTNGNGIQDAGEAGVAGVTVGLRTNQAGGAGGTVLATTTTDANGYYLFSNLTPGDYHIDIQEATLPSGYVFTAPNQGANGAVDSDVYTTSSIPLSWGVMANTTLSSGENDLTWDAGIYKLASIGDKVWCDTNKNGIQDTGESGIANVQVKLENSSGTVLQTTYTDANGNYGFDVAAGTYKVQVMTPSGYYSTLANQGSNDNIDSDINSSGVTGTYTVTASQTNLTVDAGLYRKASIGDYVWDDMNHNNLQDASEPGISGIKISLYTSAGTLVASTTTDSAGHYLFSNLNPGDYYEVFDKTNVMHYNYGAWYNMSNWKWAVQNVGSNDAIDSDVAGNAVSTTNVTQTGTIHLVSGQNDMSWDAGITPIAIDLNGDGIQTVSLANSTGTFDLLGNGQAIQSGWLSGNDGFLAVDRNGNGKIDDINELFGGVNKGDGYAKLASYDSNGDGVVDAKDADFGQLLIWKDTNGNHQTDAGELMSLADAGVTSLSLAYQALPLLDGNGNLHLERGSATLADGSTTDMTDVYFGISNADAAQAGVSLPSLSDLVSSGGSLDSLLGGSSAPAVDTSATASNDPVDCGSGLDVMKHLADLVDHPVAAYA